MLTGLLRDLQHGLKKETNYNRISMTQIVPLRIRKTIISVGRQDIHIILPKRLPTILHWCKSLMKMPLLCYLLTGTRLLALEDAEVKFTISVDEIVSRRSAAFYIDLDYIMNSSDEIKKLYMEFRQCWYDMKEIGIEIHESPVPVNGNMNIALYSDNIQLITLFHAHIHHLEKKKSPMYDEDMYKAEIEDTLQIFNVPIKEYV